MQTGVWSSPQPLGTGARHQSEARFQSQICPQRVPVGEALGLSISVPLLHHWPIMPPSGTRGQSFCVPLMGTCHALGCNKGSSCRQQHPRSHGDGALGSSPWLPWKDEHRTPSLGLPSAPGSQAQEHGSQQAVLPAASQPCLPHSSSPPSPSRAEPSASLGELALCAFHFSPEKTPA